MSPQTEPWLLSSEEPEEELAGTADELEERIDKLDDHIGDAREGLRARREDADEEDFDLDELDDEELDDDEDPLAFDDPERADDFDTDDEE